MSISALLGNNARIASQVDTPAVPVVARARVAGRLLAVPPQAYFVGSAVFHYLGPAFAVLLFARVDVLGVAWLRIAAAALIFALWRRPWRKLLALDRNGRMLIVALGVVFVALLPATASVIGIVVLHQLPSAVDLAGIALVMVGVALHRPDATRDGRAHDQPAASARLVSAAGRSA
jgi:threonine/homoserine efflux transporter RhtA